MKDIMNPIYKWPGGKGREIKLFKKYYPKSFNRYIEPFFGGGAVFFDLEHKNNIINDFNPEVTTFLKMIKNGKGQEIYNALTKMPNKEEFYYLVRAKKPLTDVEVAIRFYYIRKTCFKGMMRYNKSGEFNVPYGNYKKTNYDELLDNNYIELLKNTTIHTGDFIKIFENYNDEDDFCFLDPPYHQIFNNYISDGFSDTKHKELASAFKHSKMKCLMIIGKTNLIEELYNGYIISSYGKKYSVTTHVNTIPESAHLIIKNY